MSDVDGVLSLGLAGLLYRFAGLFVRNAQRSEVAGALLGEQVDVGKGDSRRVYRYVGRHGTAYHVGISGYDGAGIAVRHLFVALVFVDNIREEYAVDLLLYEILDVAVHQFGWETDVVGHDRVQCLFVADESRQVGEHDPDAATGEEGVPEGIVLVEIEYPGNPHDRRALFGSRPVEKQPVLVGVDVLAGIFAFAPVGEYPFAFVPRVEGVAVGEGVAAHEATVFAAAALNLAAGVAGRGQQRVECAGGRLPFQCLQGTAIGPHQFGVVAPGYLSAGFQFEGPYDSVVVHGTTLHDKGIAQLFAVLQFQYLVETVFYNRVGEARGNVGDGGPFAQHLFDFRIHKYRAAGSQIARL